MKRSLLPALVVALCCFLSPRFAQAVLPTSAELEEAWQWTAIHFEPAPRSHNVSQSFSFTYGGKPSAELLKTGRPPG